MRSHVYELDGRGLARVLWPSLGVFAACAAALHLAARTGWLPEKPDTLHADETVLRYQAAARRMPHPAEIVLVGDSTCHAGVNAAALGQQLPGAPRAINLGLIIGIDFVVYAEMAADFAAANPNQVRWVVLLITPIRPAERGERTLWDGITAGTETAEESGGWTLARLSGGQLFRERLASRVLPTPLRGVGAQGFGFTTVLVDYLAAHDGSVVDFGELQLRHGPAEMPAFPVDEDFAVACREFRAALPAGIKLAVGLTPSPAVTRPAVIRERYQEMLALLARLLEPDAMLDGLPVILPTPCFSPSAHLNADGQRLFTHALARGLAGLP